MKRLADKIIIGEIKMNIQLFKLIDTVKCTTNRFHSKTKTMEFLSNGSSTCPMSAVAWIKLISIKLLLNFYGNLLKSAVHNLKNYSININIGAYRNRSAMIL